MQTMAVQIKLGETWEPHEAIAAAMEPKSGELTVIVASATADTRIYYTVDGTKPVPSTRCPSVHNGGKIRLSSTAVIRAVPHPTQRFPSEGPRCSYGAKKVSCCVSWVADCVFGSAPAFGSGCVSRVRCPLRTAAIHLVRQADRRRRRPKRCHSCHAQVCDAPR